MTKNRYWCIWTLHSSVGRDEDICGLLGGEEEGEDERNCYRKLGT